MSEIIFSPGLDPPKRGPAPINGVIAKDRATYRREWKKRKRKRKQENIAILDMETDPFDQNNPDQKIYPFLGVLYREDAEPIVIWEEDHELFVRKIISAIEALPGEYTIYAHNGGKFDFMFLIHHLRGTVSFKGRGIMCASIGAHELRDSFHIIPEKLANWKKDEFDYSKLSRGNRRRHKAEIIRYCINDCAYLLDIVKSFIVQYGLKLSIGQAAISELKKHYNVKRIGQKRDEEIRTYFFGGRVECLAGRGRFDGHYKLYDVNSMYPAVMANCQHPIGDEYAPRKGTPNAYTAFVNVTCRNFGAFVKRGDDGETTAEIERGNFLVSIHEWKTANKYNLIEDAEINFCIDNNEFSTFDKFVHPLYANRLQTKARLKQLTDEGREHSAEFDNVKKDDIFYKLLLNNCYGKFAQNPRRFKETIITPWGERPEDDNPENPWSDLPKFETETHALWERPSLPWRFFNVGTGASITGAARAVLMEAIENATDPIYCDTDSLICRDLRNVDIDKTRLGAWDIEDEFSSVIIAGKKLYACRNFYKPEKTKVRSKGVTGLDWDKMQRIIDDEIIQEMNRAPTLTKTGDQHYIKRSVRATARPVTIPNYHDRRKYAYGR